MQNLALGSVVKLLGARNTEPVYNLHIENEHEFFANGVLVHNCMFTVDFDREKSKYSPDRLDAVVWGGHELMLNDAPDWFTNRPPSPRNLTIFGR